MKLLYSFCVLAGYKRLDSALFSILHIARNQAEQLIESNLVFVNNKVAKKSKILKTKDEVRVYAHENLDSQNPKKSPLDSKSLESKETPQIKERVEIITQTPDYIIFNKPRGLVTHNAPSVRDNTLSDYLKEQGFTLSTIHGEERCGIVHRLDKDTSGAILVAKNNAAHAHFASLLKRREMGRIYVCVIAPPLKEDTFVECYLGRSPHNRLKIAKLHKARFPKARDSKSEFRKVMLSDDGRLELVSVRLFSGRTHQIRAHLESLQRYIYGDTLYTPHSLAAHYKTKMLLHAQLLYFEGKIFTAKMPKDLIEFLASRFEGYEGVLENHLRRWGDELMSGCRV